MNSNSLLIILKLCLLLLVIYLIIKYFLENEKINKKNYLFDHNNQTKSKTNTKPLDIELASARITAQNNINRVIEESFTNANGNKNQNENENLDTDNITENIENIEIIPYLNKPNKTKLQLFYKPSCPHCINFMPTWNRIINDLPNDATYEEINCETNGQRASENNITSVPSIILLVDNEKKIYMGNRSYQDIQRFLSINGINLVTRTFEKFKMDNNTDNNTDNNNTSKRNKNLNCPAVTFDKQVELENDIYMYQIFNENGQYGYATGGYNPDKLLTPYQAAFSTVDSYLSSLPDPKKPTQNTYKNIDECTGLYKNQIVNFGLCDIDELNKIGAYADNVDNGQNKIYIDGTDYKGNKKIVNAIKKVCGFD